MLIEIVVFLAKLYLLGCAVGCYLLLRYTDDWVDQVNATYSRRPELHVIDLKSFLAILTTCAITFSWVYVYWWIVDFEQLRKNQK